jgi:hypothetical protein
MAKRELVSVLDELHWEVLRPGANQYSFIFNSSKLTHWRALGNATPR